MTLKDKHVDDSDSQGDALENVTLQSVFRQRILAKQKNALL